LRGLFNNSSAAGKVLEAVEARRVVLLLSKPLMAEYRAVLSDSAVLERFPDLTEECVEVALRRLRYFGEYLANVRTRFEFERDPRDEKLIELAIAARATDILSTVNDLLSLAIGHNDACRRFRQRLPNVRVLRPGEFLNMHTTELNFR